MRLLLLLVVWLVDGVVSEAKRGGFWT